MSDPINFDSLHRQYFEYNDIAICYRIAGTGPPLLLLHGYPQTHVMWHKIFGQLAQEFTVVASDLRGYGDSSSPPSDPKHLTYSKRTMAGDQVRLMESLGFDRFLLAGHDRGGRVGHRLALDHPETVLKLIVMDIAPTYTMYQSADREFSTAYYHWFFLIQPYDLPERMIGMDPKFYLTQKLGQWGKDQAAITSSARAEYLRCFDMKTIHASCEDYRASATIDLQHDQDDIDRNHKFNCPVLCLYGTRAFVGNKYNLDKEWRKWGEDIRIQGIPCGHYLPEEAPQETLSAMLNFLR